MPEETLKETPEEAGRVRLKHAVEALVLRYLRAYMPHEINEEQMSRQVMAI